MVIDHAQADLSTQKEEETEGPRLPGPHEDPRRAPGVKSPATERAQAVGSISHFMERRYRLRENEDFQKVRREGRSWTQPLMVLCVLPNGLSLTRFGFSVSRRIGKATIRNRVKRMMREAVRRRMSEIPPGQDLVFVARAPIAGAPFPEVAAAVEGLLSQAELIK